MIIKINLFTSNYNTKDLFFCANSLKANNF